MELDGTGLWVCSEVEVVGKLESADKPGLGEAEGHPEASLARLLTAAPSPWVDVMLTLKMFWLSFLLLAPLLLPLPPVLLLALLLVHWQPSWAVGCRGRRPSLYASHARCVSAALPVGLAVRSTCTMGSWDG